MSTLIHVPLTTQPKKYVRFNILNENSALNFKILRQGINLPFFIPKLILRPKAKWCTKIANLPIGLNYQAIGKKKLKQKT